MFQGTIENLTTKEQPAHTSYKDMENLKFQIMLTQNHFTNPNSFHISFPIKKVNITKYVSDKQLIPTSSPYETYQYSDAMIRHLPKNSLKKIEKLLIFSKKNVSYRRSIDRIIHNINTAVDITDENIEDRIDKFSDVINADKVYRISLRYYCDLRKINFPAKIDLKIKCNLETEMKILFALKKKEANITCPDAKTAFTKAPFIQYEQFLLNINSRQYIETI